MPLISTNRGHIDEEKIPTILTRLLESLGNEKSIWEYYNEMAAVDDNIREIEWRDLADTVLVFDGLFAAFLSAFLVFLIPQLQPSSTDVAMDVLVHISQQLSNSTTPAFVPTAVQVSSNAGVVNMLFFLSLALVLIDAFLAMLVKGWLREFDRGWRKFTVAHLRAQERERRLQALERWKLHELVALLPILIQGSLLLFCIGLLVLIFPLHLPTGILCSFTFVLVIGFYGFTTYVSIVNNYAPFSSPMSRLLARGLAILQSWHFPITRSAWRIASAIPLSKLPLPLQDQQVDADASHDATQPLPSNNGVAEPMQPHKSDDVERGKLVPRSGSGIDPQTYVHVLERLVSTTAEAVENIPIFLELLDKPVKDPALRPSNMDKWKELLHITFRLLRDQPTFPVSAAWTLARTTMICYNHESADRQLCLTLQHRLGSSETDDGGPRMPLSVLFSSYFRSWVAYSYRHDLWRAIAFLEPSDIADAELFWMVNTFRRDMLSEIHTYEHLQFFMSVLTYVSSTEQSRRSKVPLTAAVIYAMHAMIAAPDQGDINSIGGPFILPGTVSTSESVLMTFCPVAGIDTLDLWSEDCIRFVKNLLQRDWGSNRSEIHLLLVAALYIDSIKQAHARSTFADLLKYTKITHIRLQYGDAYDHGKLAVYWYMALSQIPLHQDHDPVAAPYRVVHNLIKEQATFQLPGLHILKIAVTHIKKITPRSSDWLQRGPSGLIIGAPHTLSRDVLLDVDHWVLLHLETLLSPQRYLLPVEMKGLKWNDTQANLHIAKARLDLYDSLATAELEGSKGPMPDPELLRVFLWSNKYMICVEAFRWCVELAPIGPHGSSGPSEGGGSSGVFIPQTMGHEWFEHFVHVLCKVDYSDGTKSWGILKSHLIPKWKLLPSPWCRDFALAFLFSIVHPRVGNGRPAHRLLDQFISYLGIDERQAYLPFLQTMLQLINSSLTLDRITSFENWLANIPERLENRDAHAHIERILATRRQQLVEETLELFAELPMADSWMDG